MSSHYTCSLGHRWELTLAAPLTAKDLPTLCPFCGGAAQAAAPPTDPAPAAGPVIPGYQILGELGRGPFGVVYRAWQVRHKRVVALKVIRNESLTDSTALVRFCREIEAVARLKHPQIVPIDEAGDYNGWPYYAMDLLEGSLQQKQYGKLLPVRQVTQLGELIARTLHFAHQQGIVHHDLKPSNVLLAVDGTPGISDFGLMKLRKASPQVTDGAGANGENPLALAYLAPEQVDPKLAESGPATDVYAVGAILYEMLTGRPPFLGETPQDTLRQIVSHEPIAPSLLQPNVPRDLETICLKCLEKDPRNRYASAEALAEDLRCFAAGETLPFQPMDQWRRLVKAVKRRQTVAALVVFLAAMSIWYLLTLTRSQQESKEKGELADQRAADIAQLQDEIAATRDKARRDVQRVEQAGQDPQRQLEEAIKARDKDKRAIDRLRQEKLEVIDERNKAKEDYQKAEERVARAETDRDSKVQRAQNERTEAVDRLNRLYVTHGTRLLEEGDLLGALPWFAEALRRSQGDAKREEIHRIRLAALLSQCPRPAHLWVHENPVLHAELSPDGRHVLTVMRNTGEGLRETVRVWGTTTGGQVGQAIVSETPLSRAAFSPDGKHILTASGKKAQVWDATTGKPVGQPFEHAEPINRALFSPDAKHVLTASLDGVVQVWEAVTGKPVGEAVEHTDLIDHVLFSPDGRRVLTATDNGTVQLWDVVTGKATGPAMKHSQAISHVSFSADSRTILTASATRRVRLWDAAKGTQLGQAMEHTDAVSHASLSPDGQRVLTASRDKTARLWDAATGKPVTPVLEHRGIIRQALFSPDGRHVLTADDTGTAQVWDAATGRMIGQALKHGEPVNQAFFSPDGRHVLTATTEGSVRVWDAVNGQPLTPPLQQGGPASFLAFTPNGQRILAVSNKTARLWDIATSELLGPALPDGELLPPSSFSLDGRYLVRLTDVTAQVIGLAKNEPVGPPLKHKTTVKYATFNADGSRLLTVCNPPGGDQATGEVRVWDAAKGEAVGKPVLQRTAVSQARFSPDGQQVLTLGFDRAVRVWDVATGKQLGKDMDHEEPVSQESFSPDGKHVLTVSTDGVVQVWDAATGNRVSRAITHQGPVNHATFSADSRQVLTASADGTAQVWDAATGKSVGSPLKHHAAVAYAAFSPNGQYVITASHDRTARIWNAKTGEPATPPLKHGGPASFASFSPDGRWAVTAGDNLLRLWSAATGEPLSPPLKYTHGSQVLNHASISDQGRLSAGYGSTGNAWARRTWDFAADSRPAQELANLVQLLGGHRLDAAGNLELVVEAELAKTWQALPAQYRNELTSTERETSWARWAAEECERQKNWTGAIGHLDHLLTVEPKAWRLHARRGRAQTELGQWDKAVADYAKAIELKPEDGELWYRRGRAQTALGQWEKATADYTKAIELKLSDKDVWARRGQAHAELGQWEKAADDFGKAVGLGTDDIAVWHYQALLLLNSNETASYRKLCARMLKRFGQGDSAPTLRTLAWTCALLSDAVPDLKALLQALERTAGENAKSPPYVLTRAILLYRSGQFEAASKQLQEAMKQGDGGTAFEWLLLAMVRHRLGQAEEAKKCLEEAGKKKPAERTPWDQRLILQLLQREATALVKGM